MSLRGEELWVPGSTDTGRTLCENEAEVGVMLPNPRGPPGMARTEAWNRLSSEAESEPALLTPGFQTLDFQNRERINSCWNEPHVGGNSLSAVLGH